MSIAPVKAETVDQLPAESETMARITRGPSATGHEPVPEAILNPLYDVWKLTGTENVVPSQENFICDSGERASIASSVKTGFGDFVGDGKINELIAGLSVSTRNGPYGEEYETFHKRSLDRKQTEPVLVLAILTRVPEETYEADVQSVPEIIA